MAKKTVSKKNSLTETDYSKWIEDMQVYVIPYLILFAATFLITLQNQGTLSKAAFSLALGAATKAVIDSLVNLLQKYRSGR